MLDCLRGQSSSFDRYYLKVGEISMSQLDSGVRAVFKLEKNLVQLVNQMITYQYLVIYVLTVIYNIKKGNIQKVILPSITIDEQPNLKTDYNEISRRVPVDKTSKKLSKIVTIRLNSQKSEQKICLLI